MRKICLLSVAAFMFATFTGFAFADDWSKTYDLGGKPDFRLQAHDANVRIEVWDQNKIEARVTTRGWNIGAGGVEIIERQQGNAVDIELRRPHRDNYAWTSQNRRIDMEIHMPRNVKVNVQTGDGSVMAKGLQGELEFTSGDGQLELAEIDGVLRLHTSDGSARVSGRLDVLDLHSSDGQVEIDALPGSQLREAWDVRCSDGSVRLRLPADLAADVDLRSSDGSITTNIPLVVEGSFNRHEIHGKMNGGGNRLSVRTSDGSVTLDKF